MVWSIRTLLPTCSAAGVHSMVARGVGELHRQVARRLGYPADLVDEVHVPGGPAELPVGGRLQADLLLHPHRAGDLLVLDRAQAGRLDPPGGKVLAGLMQPRRAQQAADVVGPERGRAGSAGHLRNSFLAPTGTMTRARARPVRYKGSFHPERSGCHLPAPAMGYHHLRRERRPTIGTVTKVMSEFLASRNYRWQCRVMIPVFARKLPVFTAVRCGRGGARRVQTGPGQVGRSWGGQG